MSEKSEFTKEEIEAEVARRRRATASKTQQTFTSECIHCGCAVGFGSGEDTSVPICGHCLHD